MARVQYNKFLDVPGQLQLNHQEQAQLQVERPLLANRPAAKCLGQDIGSAQQLILMTPVEKHKLQLLFAKCDR